MRERGSFNPEAEFKVRDRRALADRKRQILSMGDITPEDSRILAEPIFKMEDSVTVTRSSGEIESGWEVVQSTPG